MDCIRHPGGHRLPQVIIEKITDHLLHIGIECTNASCLSTHDRKHTLLIASIEAIAIQRIKALPLSLHLALIMLCAKEDYGWRLSGVILYFSPHAGLYKELDATP
jgi:hypothetical protein